MHIVALFWKKVNVLLKKITNYLFFSKNSSNFALFLRNHK